MSSPQGAAQGGPAPLAGRSLGLLHTASPSGLVWLDPSPRTSDWPHQARASPDLARAAWHPPQTRGRARGPGSAMSRAVGAGGCLGLGTQILTCDLRKHLSLSLGAGQSPERTPPGNGAEPQGNRHSCLSPDTPDTPVLAGGQGLRPQRLVSGPPRTPPAPVEELQPCSWDPAGGHASPAPPELLSLLELPPAPLQSHEPLPGPPNLTESSTKPSLGCWAPALRGSPRRNFLQTPGRKCQHPNTTGHNGTRRQGWASRSLY